MVHPGAAAGLLALLTGLSALSLSPGRLTRQREGDAAAPTRNQRHPLGRSVALSALLSLLSLLSGLSGLSLSALLSLLPLLSTGAARELLEPHPLTLSALSPLLSHQLPELFELLP